MNHGLYILDGKTPVPCFDPSTWSVSRRDKVVGRDQFGAVVISTVFLGMDHSFSGGTPVLFETMIFGGEYDGYQERYCTWDEAERGHQVACELVNKTAIDRDRKLGDLGI